MSAPPPGGGDPERSGEGDPERRGDGPPEELRPVGARTDDFLRPLFRDSTLWPILIVMTLALAAFFGSVILMALRTRSLAAVAALLGLAWLTTGAVSADLRRRRVGATSGFLLLVWAASAGVAVAGAVTGAL